MDERAWERLKGVTALVHDGVDAGASFVEKHHRDAADTTFDVAEAVPPLKAPAAAVRQVYGGMLTVSYGSVRLVNRLSKRANGWMLNRLDPNLDDAAPASTVQAGEE